MSDSVAFLRPVAFGFLISTGSATQSSPFIAYRRGFPEIATATLAHWLEHGPALVRVYPTVTTVRLIAEPMSSEVWDYDEVRSLRLGGGIRGGVDVPHVIAATFTLDAAAGRVVATDRTSDACIAWAKLLGVN